jgi:hypothetical protein
MPDIVNNVTNDTIPSSGHNIYVFALNDKVNLFNPGVFGTLSLGLGGKNVNKNNNRTSAYLWDLYTLGQASSNNAASFNFYTVPFSRNLYKPLFCESFSDNGGDNIYEQLPNFTGQSLHNHPIYRNQKYTASIAFSPIKGITLNNEQLAGEYVIWSASVIPLYPLMLTSSIKAHKSFGPAFMTQFNISVDGRNSLGDVKINCSFSGGKSLISPPDVEILRFPYVPFDDPKYTNSIVKMKNLVKKDIDETASTTIKNYDFANKYRALNLSDCAVDINTDGSVYTNYTDFINTVRAKWSFTSNPPSNKLVSMNLNITQSVDLVFTQPYRNFAPMSDIFGPKYARLVNRNVSGTITYFSYNNSNVLSANTSNLTMYFGNDFIYAMENVDWSNPRISINPDGGYFHEYDFVARYGYQTAAPANNLPYSEFMIYPNV